MNKFAAIILPLAAALALPAHAQAPSTDFGTADDREFGTRLWQALEQQELVGESAISSKPYPGTDPHGSILITLEGDVEVDGEQGSVIIKRNYGGNGVTEDSVADAPQENLMATTVMFKRADFDSEGNWFWAKYLPDGSYDQAEGKAMVGNVGMCASCHQDADGGDMVFLNNRY